MSKNKVAIGAAAAGVACGVVTAGVAAAGCAAAVGAAAGAYQASKKCNGKGAGCYGQEAAVGGAASLVGAAAGRAAARGVGALRAGRAAEGGVSLSLRYKEGWTAAQRAAADTKVEALNNAASSGALRVSAVERTGTSAASRYSRTGGSIPRGADVDHTIDLQLGGLDDVANMSPLDASVESTGVVCEAITT